MTPQPSGLTEQKVNTLIDAKIDTLVSDKVATLETAIAALTERVDALETLRDGQKELDYAFGIKQCNSLKADVEIFDKRLSAIESRLIDGELMQRMEPGSPVAPTEGLESSQDDSSTDTQLNYPVDTVDKLEPSQDIESEHIQDDGLTPEPVQKTPDPDHLPFVVGVAYQYPELIQLFTPYQPIKDGNQAEAQRGPIKKWLKDGKGGGSQNTLAQLVGYKEMWSYDDDSKKFTYLGKNSPSETPPQATKPNPPMQSIIKDDDTPIKAETEDKPSLRKLELMAKRASLGYPV